MFGLSCGHSETYLEASDPLPVMSLYLHYEETAIHQVDTFAFEHSCPVKTPLPFSFSGSIS